MSVTIENNFSNGEGRTLGDIHYLPCKIEGNGEANVTQYFESYIKKSSDESATVSFRGHPLNGAPLKLPEGYCLSVVTEGRTPLVLDAPRTWKIMGQASNMMLWNWDTPVSKNDPLKKACQWINIAEALHGAD